MSSIQLCATFGRRIISIAVHVADCVCLLASRRIAPGISIDSPGNQPYLPGRPPMNGGANVKPEQSCPQFNVVHSSSKRNERARPMLDGWRFQMKPLCGVTP